MVGKIKEAHGLRGDLYALVFSGDVSWSENLKDVYLKSQDGSQEKRFRVLRSKVFKKGLILSVEGVVDRNQSEALKGFLFHIPADLLVSKPGETIFLREIEGFEIRDLQQKVLGQITGFSSNGAQDLLLVEGAAGYGEIPFVDAFIKEINFKEKWILMDLPEGLFALDEA